ncbi:hypothetical protein OHB54_42975 [Streptomyces sp. NBC_01007]|nr:hypothetical protein OHB54_42975 [Streptomyces sp. NBC_01007]
MSTDVRGSVDDYSSELRPDDKGMVEQRVSMPMALPPQAGGISITALNAGDGTDDMCESRSQRGPTCTRIRIP